MNATGPARRKTLDPVVWFKVYFTSEGDVMPKLRRLNRGMLWFSTVLVLAFALFPSYVGLLFGAGPFEPGGGLFFWFHGSSLIARSYSVINS